MEKDIVNYSRFLDGKEQRKLLIHLLSNFPETNVLILDNITSICIGLYESRKRNAQMVDDEYEVEVRSLNNGYDFNMCEFYKATVFKQGDKFEELEFMVHTMRHNARYLWH